MSQPSRLSRRQFLGASGVLTGLIGASAVLNACGGAAQPSTAAASSGGGGRKTGWNIVISEKTAGSDPLSEYGTTGMFSVMPLVWEPLARIALLPDGKSWGAFPILAKEWRLPDPKTFEVTLKTGVKFHNGEELTAEHVKYTYDALTQMEKPGRRGLAVKFLGPSEIADKYTVRWRMPEPQNESMMSDIANMLIAPLARRDMTAENYEKALIGGTGPYKIVQWPRDGAVKLQAFDGYHWGRKAFPETITLRTIPEPSTRALEMSAGSADLADALGIESVATINADSKLEMLSLKGLYALTYIINVFKTSPPLRDVRVRQAMNYAIDREAIVKSILGGRGEVMPSWVWPGWLGDSPEVKPYPYDPTKSKALLAEAGFANGFSFNWSVTQGVYQKDNELAQAAAAQLAQVGIKANIVTLEAAKVLAERAAGTYDMTQLQWPVSWSPSTMYNSTLVTAFPEADMVPKYGPVPAEITKVRELKAAAGKATTLEQITKAYVEINKFMHDQAMWLFVNTTDQLIGARKELAWRPYPSQHPQWFDEWAMYGKKAPTSPDVPLIA